jgi:murein L,D-transpeptidase YafK
MEKKKNLGDDKMKRVKILINVNWWKMFKSGKVRRERKNYEENVKMNCVMEKVKNILK